MGRGDVITQTSFAVSPGKTSTKRVSFQCQVGEGGADVSRDVRGSGSGRVSVDVRVKQRQLACDDDDLSSLDDTTSSQTSSSCESDLPKVIGRVNTRFWEDQQKSASTVSCRTQLQLLFEYHNYLTGTVSAYWFLSMQSTKVVVRTPAQKPQEKQVNGRSAQKASSSAPKQSLDTSGIRLEHWSKL